MKITEKLNLHHIDCMDFMRDIPDGYYELAIVDPPYGIGEDGAKNHSRGKLAKAKEYTPKNWDSSAPPAEYFIELIRVSQNVIIWGANHFIENIPNPNSSSWIIWDKENGDNDFADCELAWTNHKNAVRKFEFRWAGMLQGDMKNKEIRIHPTQKPVALYKWILDKYAKPNDKILDTHGGSMSIAIACHDYGFDLDLCELDKEYFDKGVQRVKNHVAQTKLF
jgi:site-specific DNA-methyltransferase (adenine-specific)